MPLQQATSGPGSFPGSVRLLTSSVIDRIAAGEVVERPGSVVKELLENALDAGAHNVQVELEAGGLRRVCVTDDGHGMALEDAERCILRHATSKLWRAEDLLQIGTFGFRGEALSSIAAVSRLTLTTRPAGQDVGTRIQVSGGQVSAPDQVGCPVGTSVDVCDLFFNTPARQKFMRAPATEQAHAVEACLRILLGARRAGVVVTSGSRRLLDIPSDADAEARVRAALGRRVETLFPFRGELEAVRVSGFVTSPQVDRADSKGLWLFVNGRYVRDRMIQRAVIDAYKAVALDNRFPMALVHVEVAADALDVNVHPQKQEVRFGQPGLVFRAVVSALASALTEAPWQQGEEDSLGDRVQSALGRYYSRPGLLAGEGRSRAYAPSPSSGPAAHEHRSKPLLAPVVRKQGHQQGAWEVRAVLLDKYAVCEADDAIILVDLAAAVARRAFEELRQQLHSGEVRRRTLLFPETVEWPQSRLASLEARRQQIGLLGFEVELVGPGRYGILALPECLVEGDACALLDAAIRELEAVSSEAMASDAQNTQVLAKCAETLRPPARLDAQWVQGLVAETEGMDLTECGPQGSRVVRKIGREELQRWFGGQPARGA